MTSNNEKSGSRTKLIAAVKSPLGFFVLAVLVIEAVLGGLAVPAAQHQRLIIWGMLVLLGLLIFSVFALALVKPEALQGSGKRDMPTLLVAPPANLAALDLGDIVWKEDECYLIGPDLREPIELVPSPPGPGLKLHLSEDIVQKLDPKMPYRLELADSHGIAWRVRRFYFYESVRPLLCSDHDRVIQVYQSGDEN